MIKEINGGICAAKGFTANGIHCGIRKNKTKRDLALIYSAVPASAAAVYTQNLVKGAPLLVTRENLTNGKAQAVTDTKLEELTRSFPGISSSYAIQAGREIRIMVKPEEVNEDQMTMLARDIAKKIETELTYPGQIKVHLLRETKAVEYAK